MQKIFKNIIVTFLILLIVITTGGLNFFIHHCSCTNIETITVFDETHKSCCHAENTVSCCSQPEGDHKCSSPAEDSKITCTNGDPNCCKITQKFIKIEDNYLISLNKVSFIVIPVLQIIIPENIIITENERFGDIVQYLLKLPPLLTGKTLVFFLHQFKFDTPAIS